VPDTDEDNGYTVSVQFLGGIEDVLPGEIQLIESNLPELLKLLMEELTTEEE